MDARKNYTGIVDHSIKNFRILLSIKELDNEGCGIVFDYFRKN